MHQWTNSWLLEAEYRNSPRQRETVWKYSVVRRNYKFKDTAVHIFSRNSAKDAICIDAILPRPCHFPYGIPSNMMRSVCLKYADQHLTSDCATTRNMFDDPEAMNPTSPLSSISSSEWVWETKVKSALQSEMLPLAWGRGGCDWLYWWSEIISYKKRGNFWMHSHDLANPTQSSHQHHGTGWMGHEGFSLSKK